ncbi:MAG: cyclic nucleotide-binding domain-containing protein [Thermodesulfobacteriota bacterium]
MGGDRSQPAIVRLKYSPGEQIFKAGDYGVSVYRIIMGQVDLVSVSGEHESVLVSLSEGEVIGETAFLGRGAQPHPVSARAVKTTILEVWHAARLADEYDRMPTFLRHLLDQPLDRLRRTRKLVSQLGAKSALKIRPPEEKPEKREEPPPKRTGAAGSAALEAGEKTAGWASQRRRYYRKKVDRECAYRPVGAASKPPLRGLVRDVSREGVGMEISYNNMKVVSHDVGDEFELDLTLPDGKDLHCTVKLLHIKNTSDITRRFLGLAISDIGYESQKRLGFFLMP